MAKKDESPRIVRVDCTVDGHKNDWLEFDTSGWTLREFREIPVTNLDRTIGRWVETDSTDWHLTGMDGKTVPHPGRGADGQDWLDAYERMPLELGRWLSLTPYLAVQEAASPGKKRVDRSEADGDGE